MPIDELQDEDIHPFEVDQNGRIVGEFERSGRLYASETAAETRVILGHAFSGRITAAAAPPEKEPEPGLFPGARRPSDLVNPAGRIQSPPPLIERPLPFDPSKLAPGTSQEEYEALRAASEEDAKVRRLINETVESLISKGAPFVTKMLRGLGYDKHEIKLIIKESMKALAEGDIGIELDEERALAKARYDDLLEKAEQSCDWGLALKILKQRDRVTQVVSDVDTSNPMAGLAALVAAVTRQDPAIVEARATARKMNLGRQETRLLPNAHDKAAPGQERETR